MIVPCISVPQRSNARRALPLPLKDYPRTRRLFLRIGNGEATTYWHYVSPVAVPMAERPTLNEAANILQAVSPDVRIYSAGVNNSYNHPHDELIENRVYSIETEIFIFQFCPVVHYFVNVLQFIFNFRQIINFILYSFFSFNYLTGYLTNLPKIIWIILVIGWIFWELLLLIIGFSFL